jgi:hypothetical protein
MTASVNPETIAAFSDADIRRHASICIRSTSGVVSSANVDEGIGKL